MCNWLVPPRFQGLLAAMALMTISSAGRADGPSMDGDVPRSPSSVPLTAMVKPVPNAERLWQDRPISSLKATIAPPEGELPPNLAGPAINENGTLFDSIDDTRPWLVMNNFEWDAPATRHLPLFFEEPNLERLGYTYRCYADWIGYETNPIVAEVTQPVVSGVHFAANLVFMPYTCGHQPPLEPIYTLGVDRPGSPIVYRKHYPPLSLKGAAYQAGVVCGLVFGVL